MAVISWPRIRQAEPINPVASGTLASVNFGWQVEMPSR
jgi:hypothetical protein